MCASCGCKQLDNAHGDDRHITIRELRDAADAAGISVNQVIDNLREALTSGPNANQSQSKSGSGQR